MEASRKKAKPTPEHKAEAKRLLALWEKRTEKLSQEKFGEVYKIGNQSAVGQFLRGVTPLSLNAARGFAKGLRCDIAEFSPRLAEIAADAGAHAGSVPEQAPDLTTLNRLEAQLVMLYRGLPFDAQEELLEYANKLYVAHNPGRSAANPYHGVPPPGTEPTKVRR